MRQEDQVHEIETEQPKGARRRVEGGAGFIKALAEMTSEEGRLPLLLVLRPSRRFERMLARELARSGRQCGIHCRERLKESLPEGLEGAEKGRKS